MTDNESAEVASQLPPQRRRRRRRAVVDIVSRSTENAALTKEWPHRRWKIWGALSSVGLSPIFRAYVFLGSILAILAFLLYNESLTSQLREQEKSRVGLYARLISFAPMATEEQTLTIFTEVITKVDFPRIITDPRGEIIQASGIGAASERSNAFSALHALAFWRDEEVVIEASNDSTSAVALHKLMRKMDAENAPIQFYLSSVTPGLLYTDGRRAIITDTQGNLVKWRGPGLPSASDTTAAALIQVRLLLEQIRALPPLKFAVPAEGFSYLHHDGLHAIITDGNGKLIAWRGRTLPSADSAAAAARSLVHERLNAIGKKQEPLAFHIPAEHYIHYGNSDLVNRISLAPLVQMGVLLLFLLVGYIGYRNIKRSEQRSIWVGMAKETAHQLGTPLSSLSGWLELMQNEVGQVPVDARDRHWESMGRMVGEMEEDMRHLNQIASRFSQIGSVPELVVADVGQVLENTVEYFRHRSPQFGRHDISIEHQDGVPAVLLNAELISWAFENLFKNAIDAIDSRTGAIEIHLAAMPEEHAVQITFQDNGRGIEPENIKRVFEPGFSTKKRGWGLGLAFVRRIVEEYHNGRISVVQSVPGEGTTFEIVLPCASMGNAEP